MMLDDFLLMDGWCSNIVVDRHCVRVRVYNLMMSVGILVMRIDINMMTVDILVKSMDIRMMRLNVVRSILMIVKVGARSLSTGSLVMGGEIAIIVLATILCLLLIMLISVAIGQVRMMLDERLVTVECSLALIVVVTAIGMVLHLCVRVMLVTIMALILTDEDVVVLIFLAHGVTLRWSMLVSRLSTNRLDLDWSIVLALMQLLVHIRLHLENQMTIIDVSLRGAERR